MKVASNYYESEITTAERKQKHRNKIIVTGHQFVAGYNPYVGDVSTYMISSDMYI